MLGFEKLGLVPFIQLNPRPPLLSLFQKVRQGSPCVDCLVPSPTFCHADVFEFGVVDVELDSAESGDLELSGAEILAIAS